MPVLVTGHDGRPTHVGMTELSVTVGRPPLVSWKWDQLTGRRQSRVSAAGLSGGRSVRLVRAYSLPLDAAGAGRVLAPRSYSDAMRISAYLGSVAARVPGVRLSGNGVMMVDPADRSVLHGRISHVNGVRVSTAAEALRAILSGPQAVTIRVDGDVEVIDRSRLVNLNDQRNRLVGIATSRPITHTPYSVYLPPYREMDTGDSSMLPQAMAVAVAARGWKHVPNAAAMGALDEFGAVFPVLGVRQKVIAAVDSGIRLIYVPAGNYYEAKSAAGRNPDVQVVPVGSLVGALRDWASVSGRSCPAPCWATPFAGAAPS